MNISELLRGAAAQLKEAGIEQPREEAELLMALALNAPREFQLAHPESLVSSRQAVRFRRLVSRRRRHEPYAYISGGKAFYGRDFFVNRHVLIPRPETETMIEAVLTHVIPAFPHVIPAKAGILPVPKDSRFRGNDNLSILDIGTGSGAIGLTLAAELPGSKAILADVSNKALTLARRNARQLGLFNRVFFRKIDILKNGSFASLRMTKRKAGRLILVANLPYLPAAIHRRARPEVRLHEPKQALVSGKDGLGHYRALMDRLKESRLEPGILLIEADPPQFPKLEKMIHAALPRHRIEIKKDLAGNARVLLAVSIPWSPRSLRPSSLPRRLSSLPPRS